jgi:hypothetical protein
MAEHIDGAQIVWGEPSGEFTGFGIRF